MRSLTNVAHSQIEQCPVWKIWESIVQINISEAAQGTLYAVVLESRCMLEISLGGAGSDGSNRKQDSLSHLKMCSAGDEPFELDKI